MRLRNESVWVKSWDEHDHALYAIAETHDGCSHVVFSIIAQAIGAAVHRSPGHIAVGVI